MAEQTPTQNLFKIGTLLVLILVLWGVISFIFGCNFVPIPLSCDVYYGILRFSENGQPKVLIVYGDGGLGNHELLQLTMEDPSIIGLRPRIAYLETVSIGNLRDYDLVIVEEARKMPSSKLKMFMEYVNYGGRLVWTGDAGTQLGEGDARLTEFERGNDSNSNELANPWARKEEGKVVPFDEFLGVEFIGNFCELKNCLTTPYIGVLEAPERNNKFVYSITPNLKMYGNFAVVKLRGSSASKVLLNVDTGGSIITDHVVPTSTTVTTTPPVASNAPTNVQTDIAFSRKNLGKIFPIIVQNGFGGRVVYYSIPPEFFVSDGMPTDPNTGQRIKYTSFIENIYYGYFG